jgi:hypothetical protein
VESTKEAVRASFSKEQGWFVSGLGMCHRIQIFIQVLNGDHVVMLTRTVKVTLSIFLDRSMNDLRMGCH